MSKAWRNKSQSDKEFFKAIKEIKDPTEMLECLVENEEYFGFDPYYRDIRRNLLDQARLVLKKDQKNA